MSDNRKNSCKQAYEKVSEKLKSKGKHKVWGHLLKEVVQTGKCFRCGACITACDALSWNKESETPELSGKCTACGTCYYQCPATQTKQQQPIGPYKKILQGKANPEQISGVNYQNGGVTSALLQYLLKHGGYDGICAVMSDLENPWRPKAVYIDNLDRLDSIGGTLYNHAQTIPPLISAINESDAKKIAFVGTPCNIDSVVRMSENEFGIINALNGVEILKIGLFCMEAFETESLHARLLSDDIDLKEVTKMAISSGKFKVYYGNKVRKRYSLDDLSQYVDSSCKFCTDFTAENADISIGNVGSADDDNTIIVRSSNALEIIEGAVEKGYISVDDLSGDQISNLEQISLNKAAKILPETVEPPRVQRDKFIMHKIKDWTNVDFGFTPIVSEDKYIRQDFQEFVISNSDKNDINKNNLGESPDVYVSKIPDVDGTETIPYSYSSAYDLTMKLLADYDRINGGKVLIKPNNTGFVGVFKTDALNEVLKENGITDNADDQQIATQPSVLKGMVDALIDLGAERVDIGENMLWDGGTPRAFYETGYTEVFKDKKYRKKVNFIDFYENDPPVTSLEPLHLEENDYCKYDYYNRCYPPKALFEENYDLIYIASVVKTHNCSYYSLSTKNFSVTWNPRKKTGNVPPRWHIHGLPIKTFLIHYVKQIMGPDFKRKYRYLVREVYKYPWKNADAKERIVKKRKRKVIVTNEFSSSGLMDTITTSGHEALDVDPHHWTGITLAIMNLGIGYLITRFTRIFSAVLKRLYRGNTRVATLCSGVVAQQKDGPLVYGSKKYGGFMTASFDHVALEKVTLDIMFGKNEGGFKDFIVGYQKALMQEYKATDEYLIKDAERMWTLEMLQHLVGGTTKNDEMGITLLDYTNGGEYGGLSPNEMYKIRRGDIFDYSKAFYVCPTSWIHAIHTDDELAMRAFIADKKTIKIPLIPGVVK